AERSSRRVLLAGLADPHRLARQPPAFVSVLRAPDAKCLGADRAGVGRRIAWICARCFEIEPLGPGRIGSPRPLLIGLLQELRGIFARRRRDRFDRRRRAERVRASHAAEHDDEPLHRAFWYAARAAESAAGPTTTKP